MNMLVCLMFLLYPVLITDGLPLSGVTGQSTGDISNCSLPDDIEKLFQSLNTHINSSMYLQFNNLSEPARYMATELNTHLVFVDKPCPNTPVLDMDAPIAARSLCPWYYDVEELPGGHFPGVIPQAKCKCNKCIENNLRECDRVSTNVRILKETGCVDGLRTYVPVLRTHYVSCVCVSRRLQKYSTSTSTSTPATTKSPCGPIGCIPRPSRK